MERAYHERCPTAEAYRLHDDDDDDDGEIFSTRSVLSVVRIRMARVVRIRMAREVAG